MVVLYYCSSRFSTGRRLLRRAGRLLLEADLPVLYGLIAVGSYGKQIWQRINLVGGARRMCLGVF